MATNNGSQYTDPGALTTVADVTRAYPELVADIEADEIADTIVEATSQIEIITSRRMAPFTNLIYTDRLTGIDPDEYGSSSDAPTDIFGSLGISLARSLGFAATDLVRHFWLPEFAPYNPELWTYDVQAIEIYHTYGSQISVNFQDGGLVGPEVSDGHCWLRLGTFAPKGSRIRVIYNGGYTLGVPPALARATRMLAAKYMILDHEPQMRKELSLADLDKEVERLLVPWVRG